MSGLDWLVGAERKQVEGGKAAFRLALSWREKSQWAIGDAALLIAPLGEAGVNTGRLALLERFVRAEVEPTYDLSFNTVRVYRTVSAAWPPDSRIAAPWSVHQVLVAEPNRHLIREGMTKAEALRARAEAASGRLAEETAVPGGLDGAALDRSEVDRDEAVPAERAWESPLAPDDLIYLRERIGRVLAAWAAESSRVALSVQAATSADWPDVKRRGEYEILLDTITDNLALIYSALQGRLSLEAELERLRDREPQWAAR